MASSQQLSPAGRVAARVFPWVVAAAGGLAIYVGAGNLADARASRDWPSVEGTITVSDVVRETERTSATDMKRTSVTWRAKVAYRYVVDGTSYEGTRIAYGAYDTAERERAARTVARYPVGHTVVVFYKPADPAESVLEPGTAGVPWFFLALGSVFLLVGLIMARYLPRAFAPRPKGSSSAKGGFGQLRRR